MDHYLLTARSITHAQRMAQVLARAGINVKLRRIGSVVTGNGCGYSLEVPERKYRRAADALREAGLRPVKIFFVSGGTRTEVAL